MYIYVYHTYTMYIFKRVLIKSNQFIQLSLVKACNPKIKLLVFNYDW